MQDKDKKGLLCTLSKLAILSTSTIQHVHPYKGACDIPVNIILHPPRRRVSASSLSKQMVHFNFEKKKLANVSFIVHNCIGGCADDDMKEMGAV